MEASGPEQAADTEDAKSGRDMEALSSASGADSQTPTSPAASLDSARACDVFSGLPQDLEGYT